MSKRMASVNPRIKPWIVPALAVAQFIVMWAVAGLLMPVHMTYAQSWKYSNGYLLGDMARSVGADVLTAASFLLMGYLLVLCVMRSAGVQRMVHRLTVPRRSAFARRDEGSP